MFLKIAAIVNSEYRFVFDCGLRTMFLWRKMQINTRRSQATF